MTTDFVPRPDILPPSQRRLWDESAAVPAEFVLYGGTAIALHLPQITLKALSYFDDGNLHSLPLPLKDRLIKAVCEVDLDRLPVIAAPYLAAISNRGFTQ